jgi:3-hydroxyisobutyrate dehydrogenase
MTNEFATGVIGLGSMGLAMAATLAKAGFDVRGYDVSAARRHEGTAIGLAIANDAPSAATDAGCLVLSLPSAEDVEAVMATLWPTLERAAGRRIVIIDTTTSRADVSRVLAGRLAGLGHAFLDAPVSGGPTGAATGNLTAMIGGDALDLAWVRPVLESLANRIIHVGPSGAGNVAKLANNLLAAAHVVTTREALRLACAEGIDPAAMLEVINAASGRSAISEVHFPTWVLSGRFDSGFSMALMRKDIRLALEMTQSRRLRLPLAEMTAAAWEASQLPDGADFTRMGDLRLVGEGCENG